jgi:hypothetical protein
MMRTDTTDMALRFLDAAFAGSVRGRIASNDTFIITVRYRDLEHEVILRGAFLDWEPTTIMAPLLPVPALLREQTAPIRVIVTDTGLHVEPRPKS